MDDIVREIYTAVETQPHLRNTLFVVGGDHGMNSKGNHGGSSDGETSAALMFISPHLKRLGHESPCPTVPHTGKFGFYTSVDQSDIVPTLSGLLGFPIPRNSLGVFIRDFLPLLGDSSHHLQFLQANAAQLMNIFQSNNGPSESCNSTTDVSRLDCLWGEYQRIKVTTKWVADDVVEELYRVCFQLISLTER